MTDARRETRRKATELAMYHLRTVRLISLAPNAPEGVIRAMEPLLVPPPPPTPALTPPPFQPESYIGSVPTSAQPKTLTKTFPSAFCMNVIITSLNKDYAVDRTRSLCLSLPRRERERYLLGSSPTPSPSAACHSPRDTRTRDNAQLRACRINDEQTFARRKYAEWHRG